MYGLYLHIPYCVRKCLYCDFYSVETQSGPVSQRKASPLDTDNLAFLDALESELKQLPPGFAPTTIFIGGGTPTELSDNDFARLLDMIPRHVGMDNLVEWSCESNPGTLTRSKAEALRPAGVNRVSLGVQSFHPETLEFLGRIHSGQEAIDGYHLLRDCGIDNINLDLIFAVPGSTSDRLAADLDTIVGLGPEHTSCYCLMFEPGTPLTQLKERGYVREVADDDAADQYDQVRTHYLQHGYLQYEISNFARPGRECLHNQLYWGPGEYIGCGPAAHSHWQGQRYGNVASIKRYCRALEQGESPRTFTEQLDPAAKAREALVMGLRRREGVNRTAFLESTGFDYDELAGDAIRRLLSLGLIEQDDTEVRLSERALFLSDAVFAELI